MKKSVLTLAACAIAVAAFLTVRGLDNNSKALYTCNIEALAQSESGATNLADCAMTGTNSTDSDAMYHCSSGTDDNTVYSCTGSVKKSTFSSTKKCKTN